MEIQRGFRDKLENHLNLNQPFEVEMITSGEAVYDCCCFGVDANNKLSDDRYMIFYNQTSSPNGEIKVVSSGSNAKFALDLSKLPSSINKLVFTVSIDGSGTMGQINSHVLSVSQTNSSGLRMNLNGSDFHEEKAIISIEIYKKDSWRLAAVASGFNGGLSELLKSYGGEEIPLSSVPEKVSLEKKLQENAPQLVSLAKPLKIELEKRNLQDCIAKVALVLDISGSMTDRYSNGTVQEIVNKILPLAVQFDDDGELDFWYYGSSPKRMPSVNMKNYSNAVPKNWSSLMDKLGYGNNEPKVMKEVIDEYRGGSLPVYVVFVTDGEVGSECEIKKLLIEASKEPIFWQFVGVGGYDYGILEELDNMAGRFIDNANFFALDDFKKVSNPELYSRLLNEFPSWLKEAKSNGII